MDKVAIKARLETMGSEAADAFLARGTPLNEKINKIAQENGLSTDEIARVCEMANHEVFRRKYASEDNKMFEFPLADAKEVIAGFNPTSHVDREVEDLAPYMKDIKVEEVTEKAAMSKVATDSGEILFQESAEEDGYHPTRRQFVSDMFEKTAEAQIEIRHELRVSMEDLEKLAEDFCEEAKQYVLNGHDINKLACWCAGARPGNKNLIGVLFEKVAQNIHSFHWKGPEQLEKVAGPVTSELLTQPKSIGGDPVQVINGNNSMIQILDTLVAQATKVDQNMLSYVGVDDTVKFLRGKVVEGLSQEYEIPGEVR